MKKVDFKSQSQQEELDQVQTQIDTIKQYNSMLSKLNVNEKVVKADIHELFLFFNMAFFNNSLDSIILEWSKRMTYCAGICYYERGLCTIRLSMHLLKYRSEKELQETLIHEMIHAHLFLTKKGYDRDGTDGHGKDFQDKMKEVNAITVSMMKQRVIDNMYGFVMYDQFCWQYFKLKGSCRKKPPYFGIVKRARNMPPGPQDDWFEKHQQKCGGQFVKIAEPEGYKMKGKKEDKEKANKKVDGNIENFFKKTTDQDNKKRTREEAKIEEIIPIETKKRKQNDNGSTKDGGDEIDLKELLGVVDEEELYLQLALLNQLSFNQ